MNFIKNLREKRLNWIKANRENGFENGIRNLLTELYPDNAHFIYELLQNAEDAKATKVMFVLNFNGLSFCHNGNRQFTDNDIDSITSIGVSTKIGDFNQIGKFGVGFKSVFSYTNTPKIYSNKYAFEIHDLVCPREIEQKVRPDSTSTLFHFPFDHDEKSKEKAFQEVKETLTSLPENTILFLQNIDDISWEISDGEKECDSIKRSKTAQYLFEIEKSSQKSNWLLFRKDVPNKQGLYVAIAFRLVAEGENFKFDRKVEKGDVSIFFPAEKEVSNLKFFVHAPFAATVARDSIQNKEENDCLRDLLIELFKESLPKIKKLGMLDKNFLAILPNNKDVLSNFYVPFRKNIIKIFQNEPFTPTWRDEFSPSSKLLQATNEIKNVINNDSILSYIIDEETTNNDFDWATNAERGSRAFSFLESLDIREVNLKEVLDKTASTFSLQSNSDEFLSKLSDDWMQSFYTLLGKGIEANKEHFKKPNYWDKEKKVINAFLVRLQNGTHSKADSCYFENDFVKKSEELNIVRAKTYEVGEGEKQNARLFLESIGVKTFDEKQEVTQILKRHYGETLRVTEEQNIQHIEKFIEFLRKCPHESKLFSDFYILRTENEDTSKRYYSKPAQVCLDKPFEETKILSIAKIRDKKELWKGYETTISNKSNFVEFLKKIGLSYQLEIETCRPYHLSSFFSNTRETSTATISDYTISLLPNLLENCNDAIAELIWQTMIKTDAKVLKSKYRPNQEYALKEDDSTLVRHLKNACWIPDKEGYRHKPKDIHRQQLPDNFVIDNRNGWLDAIGLLDFESFEEERRKVSDVKSREEKLKKEKAAKELGIDLTEIEEYKKEKEEFEKYKREKRAKADKSLQRKPVPTTNQNWNFSDYDFDDLNSNLKDRSRTVSENHTSKVIEYAKTKIEARSFLKSQYTDALQTLNCQICQEEMPFQTSDGEWYFIATKIIEKTNKDNVANYLCCCPNCSEMYKHANSNKDKMIEIILESDFDNCTVTLELAGNEIDIEFTKKHFEELFNFADRQNF